MAKDKGGNLVVAGNKVIIPVACPINAMAKTKVSVIKPSLPSMMVVKSNTVCKLGNGALQLKPPLYPTLTHWWKCDEVSGNRADYKGGLTANQIITLGSNEGAANFVTYRTGLLRTAAFALPQPFSIGLWFKAASLTADGSMLIQKTDGVSDLTFQWTVSGPNSMIQVLQSNAEDQLIATELTLGAWHHLLYTSGESVVSLYADGANSDGGGGSTETVDGGLRIGNELPNPSGHGDLLGFPGLIRNVMVFNAVLSEAQITAIYAAGPYA